MSLFSRLAQRIAGSPKAQGRDLQLRAETLLLYSLATKSAPLFGNSSPNIISRSADLVNADCNDAPDFEKQSSTVRTFLIQSVLQALRTTSKLHRGVAESTGSMESALENQLGFVPVVAESDIPNAGLGLHIQGRAVAGSLLGLYPGTCYLPSDLSNLPGYPRITDNNDYLLWRYDGIVIDGKDAVAEESLMENIMAEEESSEDCSVEGSSNSSEPSGHCILHPFSCAHRINHPPSGAYPNCLQFLLDLPITGSMKELRSFVPNQLFGPVGKSRSLFERLQNTGMRQRVASVSAFANNSTSPSIVPTIAVVATRDLRDEEVLMNYRFNPNGPDVPAWYHDCDPESSARRWTKTGIFL